MADVDSGRGGRDRVKDCDEDPAERAQGDW